MACQRSADKNTRNLRTVVPRPKRYALAFKALGAFMTTSQGIIRCGILLGLVALSSACVVAEPRDGYREGYYDRDHHRYYHENSWHECGERDEHCR